MNFFASVLFTTLSLCGLQANAQCTSVFTSTPVNARTRQFTHVIGAGEDSTTTYHWAFGDGDTANVASPLYTFADTGTFNVCLTVYTASINCTSDTCLQIRIDTCQAYFSYVYDPAFTQPEQDIYFFTDSSFGEDSSTTYLWDFGTGDFSTMKNISFGFEPDDSGTKQICLTIHNADNGCTNQYCRTISIDNLCIAATYSYTFQNDTGVFKAAICGQWDSIKWSFGDGTFASQTDSVVHAFASATDSYSVCLYVNYTAVCQRLFPCHAIYCQEIHPGFTGIENIAAPADGFTVFPNPSSGAINITYTTIQTGQVNIDVSDITGKQVKRIVAEQRSPNSTTSINIAELPAGIYFVRLTTEEGQWVRKLVVER